MKDHRISSSMQAENAVDASVPQGAPKPSVLNKLRSTGRMNDPLESRRRGEMLEEKLRKAQEYKRARAEAKAKEEAELAKKAMEGSDKAAEDMMKHAKKNQ